ncbi:uncharacterized protein A1O5_06474 [Cladophialophora psammophila CBS 110553]|uniref:AB hydrolase-1 domain-containing protein n=1 Tax=Cladophialophora psammophila CBS 110553 TaxID=1182543 RepID=W9X0H8_9EURO|nr:uncharacterized protein A1O5_06474 [Cladophialophora psammophila CBS 110553]EXJ70406.1 hypothetical protein A1O5_06474 [Cladophialophora psammophila CBS 110553]
MSGDHHQQQHLQKSSLEPRFSLPRTTPASSRTDIVIGGIRVYVYGLDELAHKTNAEVAVLYLAHNRKRSYLVTEDIAYEVLHRYRTEKGRKKKYELIALTINMRNHGDREVCVDFPFPTSVPIFAGRIPSDSKHEFEKQLWVFGSDVYVFNGQVSPQANYTWDDENDNHGMDLLSMISGSAQDFKLILDYLPAYLPQFTRFHNIMAGVSLGGHTAWRMAPLASPGQIEGFAMVVGCPSLTPLLLSRLGIDTAADLTTATYDDLEKVMTAEQKRRWPRVLAELVQEGDRAVADTFPADLPVLLCSGALDPLVPARYTAAWVERRRHLERGGDECNVGSDDGPVRFFVQENTGHSCTKEMVALLASWLGDVFQA